MNARITVAQAGSSASNAGGPPRVIKVVKPAADQSITLELGYDQKVKLDFTDIANEKITLVHIGEKLIILFENKSKVTIHPFFDSMGVPLQNLSVEASPGTELSSGEFASTFPITVATSEDQLVYPGAGEGAPGTPAAGANFTTVGIDDLFTPNPLPLLGPEQLGGIQFGRQEGFVPEGAPIIVPPVNGLPTIGLNGAALLDDDVLANGNPGGVGDDPDSINATGVLTHGFGTDGAGTVLLTAAGAILPPDFSVAVNADGTILTIHQISTNLDVLEISLTNTVDGAYTVKQLNPINHPAGGDENNLEFAINYVVADANGDSVTGLFTVNVDDDTPVRVGQVSPITATVLEAGLSTELGDFGDKSEGIRAPGETTLSDETSGLAGSLTALILAGADGPATVGMSTDTSGLPTLFSHGEPLTYEVVGNTLTASTSLGTVFTLQVNPDGSWSFDLDDQLDHVEGFGENLDLRSGADGSTPVGAIDFSSIILATDKDGDSVNVLLPGDFTIAVKDDIPAASQNVERAPIVVLEDGLSIAEGDLSEGNRESGETTSSDEASGPEHSLTTGVLPGADEILVFSVSVDTSSLPILYSRGVKLDYEVVGGKLVAIAKDVGQIFTLQVNTDGSWSFDLTGQLDHVDDGTNSENFELRSGPNGTDSVSSIDFSSLLIATDADGDSVPVPGGLVISIQDDVPVPVGEPEGVTAKVYEDSLSTAVEPSDSSEGNREGQTTDQDTASGVVGSLKDLFLAGADEELTFTISSDTGGLPDLYSHGTKLTYEVSPSGDTLTATAGTVTVFTLTVNADGSWTFDLDDQLDHVDANGDTGTDLLTSAPGVEPVTSTPSIDFSTIIVATDEDGDSVTGAAAGSFAITIENDVPVPVGEPEGVTAKVYEDSLSTAVEPSDSSEGNREGQTTDQDTASGVVGSLKDLFLAGADEELTFTISSDTGGLPDLYSHGTKLTYEVSPSGDTLTATAGTVTVFTLTVNADGSWTFDLDDQLDHVDANGDTGTDLLTSAPGVEPVTSTPSIDFSTIIVATDEDGDSVTGAAAGSFAITIENDVPVPVGEPEGVTAKVYEDSLSTAVEPSDSSEGNREGQTTDQDTASGVVGSLKDLFLAGADEELTFTISSDTGGLPDLYSHGTKLTYEVSPSGDTLTATAGTVTVFTLTVNADGSWTFDLDDQLDHVDANGDTGTDLLTSAPGVEPVTSTPSIDFSTIIVATDEDGDSVTGAAAGSFAITIENDVPTITAREAEETETTETITIVYSLRAGNTDFRAMDGEGDRDILLTGEDLTENDDSVNTQNVKIGVGDGQIIDGREVSGNQNNPNISGPEILTLAFVNALQTQGNPNPSFSHSGSYDVDSVTFTIDVAESQSIDEAVLFIAAKDDGAFEDITVEINDVVTAGTPVFVGGNLVGYVFDNVPDGAVVKVIGDTPFDELQIGNYNNFTFDSTAGGFDTTLTGGNPFKVFGIEGEVTVTTTETEVFRVAHDESAGVNNTPDPNDADDTGDTPPALIQDADALGYAKSALSVLTLFSTSIGADENGSYEFEITDSNGNPLDDVVSGLSTLDGTPILLSTDANGVLTGSANGTDVFKAFIDGDGFLWIAQYEPIKHGLEGGSAAAFDEIAKITADLRVKATIIDEDKDPDTAISDVALSLEFQDDGLSAVDDEDSVTEDGPVTATGNVVLGGTDVGDANTTDGVADALGADGFGSIAWDNAIGTTVSGLYGTLTVGTDGSYTYTLYTEAQNPSAYAEVQSLGIGDSLTESFDYTITDGDGDTAGATLLLTIDGSDDGVTISDLASEGGDTIVDEKGLPARNSEPEGSGEAASPAADSDTSESNTGTFTFSSPDGLGTLQIEATSITLAQLQNSGLTPITIAGGSSLGTLEIIGFSGTAAGGTVTYRFTLLDNTLLHPNTTGDLTLGDRGTDDQFFVDYSVTVTDDDGSDQTATLTVAINDDGPVATNDGNLAMTEEDVTGLTIGTVAGILGNDSFGADGQGTPAITIAAGDQGGTVNIVAGDLVYTNTVANATPGNPVVETFVYTIQDGDGDTTTASFTVTLTDTGVTEVAASPNLVADDDDVAGAGGNPLGTGDDAQVLTGAITYTLGDDAIGSVELSTAGDTTGLQTLAGQAVDTIWESGQLIGYIQGSDHTVAANQVFTITVSNVTDTGADYTLALLKPVKHLGDGTEDNTSPLTVDVLVTDADGSTNTTNFTVVIDDDTPVAVNDGNLAMTEEDVTGLTIGTVAGILGNDSFGADGQGTPAITIAAGDQGGTVNIVAGDLVYTNTVANATPGNPVVETFVYTIQDGDGDTTTASFTVTLTDTGVTEVAASPNLVADDDDVAGAGGNPLGTGDDAQVLTGAITYTLGDDAIGSVELSTAGDTTGLQTLAGQAVDTIWESGQLIGYIQGSDHTVAANQVFTITVSNVTDTGADYTLALLKPVKHLGDGTEDNTSPLTVDVLVTDADGSTNTTNFTVVIDDDTPVAVNDGNLAMTEEDVTGLTIGTVAGILGNDSFGADGQGTPAITIAAGDQGGTVNIVAGDLVYTNTVANATPGNPVVETFVYTIQDGDGDTTTASFTVTLTDTGVTEVAASPNLVADDDDVAGAGGNPLGTGDDAQVLTGAITYTLGDDAIGSVELSTAGDTTGLQTLAGQAVDTIWESGQLIGYIQGSDHTVAANQVFTITVSNVTDTGADYTLALLKPVKHLGDGTEDNTSPLTVDVLVTDADGSTNTTNFTVVIDDDTPVAVNDGNLAMTEEDVTGLTIGTVAGILGNDSFGADGQGTPAITIAAGDQGGTVNIVAGDLVYTNTVANATPGNPVVETFVYTIQDGDGDTTTASFTVTLTDTGVTEVAASPNLVADDDDVAGAGGNPLGTGDDAQVLTGAITYTLGDDAIGSVELSTAGDTTGLQTLAGQAVDTIWESGQLIGYIQGSDHTVAANQVFTITVSNVTDTGADYTLALLKPVKHLGDGTEDNTSPLTVDVLVTDADGSTNTTNFTVVIDDDTPVAVNDGNLAMTEEDVTGLTIGTVAGILGNDSFGADGQGTPAITIAAGDQGGTVNIVAGDLVYTNTVANATPGNPVVETFVYTIQDGDGDTTTASFTVTLTDTGVTEVAASPNLVADDDDVAGAGGNPLGTGDDAQVLTGAITYTLGDDAIGSVELSTAGDTTGLQTLAGQAVDTIWESGQLIGYIQGSDHTVAANQVFTITVSNVTDTGADYTLALLKPVKHLGDGTEDNTSPLTVDVLVTDADGSTNTTNFTVVIDDDTPVAVNDGNLAMTEEDVTGLTIGTVAGILGNDSFGADGQGTPAITIAAGDQGGTVNIVAGDLVYTNTVANATPGNPVVETFVYTIQDGDGDTTTASFTVTLTDTGVIEVAASPNLVADDDDVAGAGGNPLGTGDDAQVLTGAITYTLGDDAIGSVELSTAGDTTGLQTLAGQAVDTIWESGQLIGYIQGSDHTVAANQVFTITVSNVTDTGADYTLALLKPVKHLGDGTEDNTSPLTVDVLVTDADGSTNTTNFTVVIDDDTPVAVNDGNLAMTEEDVTGLTIGTVAGILGNDSFGADGQGTPAITIAAGDQGGTVNIVAGDLVYTNTVANATPGNPVVETFVYTIQDGDGDTTTASFTVTLTDTGVTEVAASPNLVADDDDVAGAGGNPLGTGDDAQVLTGAITYTLGDDAIGSVELSTAGDTTGLQTLAGQAVDTIWESGQLIGYIQGSDHTVAANQVFTITVSNVTDTGADYTLALLKPVKHLGDGTEDNTSPLTVDVLVTDADGSTNTTNFTVVIDDDTPDVDFAGTATVNENGAPINGTYKFSDGADGTQTGTLSVDVNGGTPQTFTAAQLADGESINTGVGTLALSAPDGSGNGTWTFTPAPVTATANVNISITLTDGDGDSDTDTHTIEVVNVNAPLTVSGTITAVVEEEHLNTAQAVGNEDTTSASSSPNNDQDTAGNFNVTTNVTVGTFSSFLTFTGNEGALAYSFASGLEGTQVIKASGGNLTSEGANVLFHVSGATLIGYVDTGTLGFGAGDRQVFTLELNQPAAGQFRFTLLDNLDHHTVADNVENIIGINLNNVIVVTDTGDTGDDEPIANFTLNVIDDVPMAFTPEPIFIEDVSHASALTGQINFASKVGADGVGDVVFNTTAGNITEDAAVKDISGNDLFFNGEQLFYHIVNSHTVEARSSAANGSDLAFTAVLTPGSDTWSLTLNGTIFNGSAFNTTTFVNPGGGNNGAIVLDSPGSSNDLLATANGTNNVNTNNNEWGVASGNSITNGETIRFDLVTNAATDGTVGGTTYTTHYEVGSYSQKVTGLSGSQTATFKIRAVNADNDLIFVGDGSGETTAMSIIVTVTNAGGTLTPVVTVNGDGTVTLSNIELNDVFTIISNADPFSAVEITGLSGTDTFKLVSPSFTTANAVNPFDISLPVIATDADGDQQTGTLTAKFNPDASTLEGTSGNDILTATATNTKLLGEDGDDTLTGLNAQVELMAGGRGNDTLSGLGGNDSLWGGSGSDRFQWGAEALSAANADVINDYKFAEGDKIDLQTLVPNIVNGTAIDYVHVVASGSDLLVQVDTNGTAGGAAFVTAYTLTGANTTGIDTVRFSFGGQNWTITDTNVVAGAADPIILDLGAAGLAFTALDDGVSFDINADGAADQVAWTTGEDGILVLDLDGSGTIDNGTEIFSPWFGGGNYASSLAALATLDQNGDGLINSNDAVYGALKVWQDLNHNGISEANELKSLATLGITEIDLAATLSNHEINGQTLRREGTFTYADGTTGGFAEVDLEVSLGVKPESVPQTATTLDFDAGATMDAPLNQFASDTSSNGGSSSINSDIRVGDTGAQAVDPGIFQPDGGAAGNQILLASIVNGSDGKITAADVGFNELQVQRDVKLGGLGQPTELMNPAILGITAIDLAVTSSNQEINGQTLRHEGEFTYANGTTGGFAKADLEVAPAVKPDSVPQTPTTLDFDAGATIDTPLTQFASDTSSIGSSSINSDIRVGDTGAQAVDPGIFQPDGDAAGNQILLANSSDGELTAAADVGFNELQVQQDVKLDGLGQPTELMNPAILGITAIDLAATSSNQEINGQSLRHEGEFTYANGTTGGFAKADLEVAPAVKPDSVPETPTTLDFDLNATIDTPLTQFASDTSSIGGSSSINSDIRVGNAGAQAVDPGIFQPDGGAAGNQILLANSSDGEITAAADVGFNELQVQQDVKLDGLSQPTELMNLFGSAFNDALRAEGNVNALPGKAGENTPVGEGGGDTLTGATSADHAGFDATTEGLGDIIDFNTAQNDTIDLLTSAFGGGLAPDTDATGKFGSSANNTLGSGTERFHHNTTDALLYDADGSSAASSAISLAALENGAGIDAPHARIV